MRNHKGLSARLALDINDACRTMREVMVCCSNTSSNDLLTAFDNARNGGLQRFGAYYTSGIAVRS
jgi:hypothetical protein